MVGSRSRVGLAEAAGVCRAVLVRVALPCWGRCPVGFFQTDPHRWPCRRVPRRVADAVAPDGGAAARLPAGLRSLRPGRAAQGRAGGRRDLLRGGLDPAVDGLVLGPSAAGIHPGRPRLRGLACPDGPPAGGAGHPAGPRGQRPGQGPDQAGGRRLWLRLGRGHVP